MGKLIIADDNRSLTIGLQRFFRKKGYDVSIAFDGEELLSLCKDNHVEVVVLDLRMPRMNGLAALEKIKEHSPKVRAIVITGFGDSEALAEATRLGVRDFLTKPFGLDEIEKSVLRAMNQEELSL
ncbi:MAG: response regulator [Deltaproteobacteria bacterium]|nr:response regulator [Deltaproteobacteria bacterium]